MNDFLLSPLIADLPEIYQPVFGHPGLSTHVSRQCTDRLENIAAVHDALQGLLGRPLRVLDLGCAQGFFSLSLAERCGIVHGVDYLDKNIAVCKALATENQGLSVSFEVDRIENVINHLEADQYDLVLGLSVFHHLVHEHGVAKVRELLDRAGACSAALVGEFALRDEPLYWAPAQPHDPRTLLEGYAFVHELARHNTHLAPIPRPLYVASNHYWVLDGLAGKFDSWTTESHALAQGTHQGTRRYYFNADSVVKLFRFDHQRGAHNRQELQRESQFIANPPAGFRAPTCLASGTNDLEGWLVVQRLPGKLLLDMLREQTDIDHLAVLRAVLEQLTILEAAGLYHDDVRTWNVLLNGNETACLIDYGSISPKAQDCDWPENIFLAFFIFVRELATGIVEHPVPLRTVSISPYNLPQPYRAWAASLWKRPLREWRFKLMLDLLDTLPDINQSEALDSPQDVWTKAIENAIQIQSQMIHHQKGLFSEAEDCAQQGGERVVQAELRALLSESRLQQTETESRAKQAELELRAEVSESRVLQVEAESRAKQAELELRAEVSESGVLQVEAESMAKQAELELRANQVNSNLEATRKELREVHQANHHHWLQLEATRKELHDLHQANHYHYQLAEARNREIQALRASRSWRITASMRWIADFVLRRDGATAVLPAPTFLNGLIRWGMAQPKLVNLVHESLRFAPAMRNCLARRVEQAMGSQHTPPLASPPNTYVANHVKESVSVELTPGARQILADLKAAIERRQRE